jgi:hypothetical protein
VAVIVTAMMTHIQLLHRMHPVKALQVLHILTDDLLDQLILMQVLLLIVAVQVLQGPEFSGLRRPLLQPVQSAVLRISFDLFFHILDIILIF